MGLGRAMCTHTYWEHTQPYMCIHTVNICSHLRICPVSKLGQSAISLQQYLASKNQPHRKKKRETSTTQRTDSNISTHSADTTNYKEGQNKHKKTPKQSKQNHKWHFHFYTGSTWRVNWESKKCFLSLNK